MSATPLLVFNPNNTLGALEIGTLISSVLFGVLTMQVYVYYKNFPEDKPSLKFLVAIVWLLELGHTICTCMELYQGTITYYGNPLRYLLNAPTSLIVGFLLAIFTACLVQVFFAQRIRVVSGKFWLAGICWVLSFAALVLTIIAAVIALRVPETFELNQKWWPLFVTVLAMLAGIDVSITAILCWYLANKRKSAYLGTTTIVDHLIRWSIETCFLVSLSSVAGCISLVTMKDNLVWVGILIPIAKMYSNSLLASLNGRAGLRGADGRKDDMELTSSSRRHGTLNSQPSRSGVEPVRVEMSTVLNVHSDPFNSYEKYV